jgi:hypothetical protein
MLIWNRRRLQKLKNKIDFQRYPAEIKKNSSFTTFSRIEFHEGAEHSGICYTLLVFSINLIFLAKSILAFFFSFFFCLPASDSRRR